MEVILLERVAKLGQIGDVVRVKDGFARNYLLPKGKALRATKENRSRFESMKVELEARNLEQRSEAQKVAEKLDGQSFTVLRQAAEGGQLYGSVAPRDLAALVSERAPAHRGRSRGGEESLTLPIPRTVRACAARARVAALTACLRAAGRLPELSPRRLPAAGPWLAAGLAWIWPAPWAGPGDWPDSLF